MPDDEGQDAQKPRKTDVAELDKLIERFYVELQRTAAKVQWRGPIATRPTSLVHDAYLKLRQSPDTERADIVRVFAKVMRNILIDKARKYRAAKRGGGETIALVTDEVAAPAAIAIDDILVLESALMLLERESPRQARVVECKFMLGCTTEETGMILDISVASVERDWSAAKVFLSQLMKR